MSADWRIDIDQRKLQPEWMDQPELDVGLHQAALQGLMRVNALSLVHRTFWTSIRKLAQQQPTRELRLLDVACGAGDVATRLCQLARQQRIRLVVSGCDVSPTAIEFARQRAATSNVPLHFFQFDVLKDRWPTDYDIIVNSLFLHHLRTDDASEVLARMGTATRQLVLVNDLVRCRWGYLLARFAARLVSHSPIVHNDGPISVKAAFTKSELEEMAKHAGLNGAVIERCWPARMVLKWNKT